MMLPLCHMADKNVKEWYAQIKKNEPRDKPRCNGFYRKNGLQTSPSELLKAGYIEYQIKNYFIEFNFQKKFQEFAKCYLRLTHEIPSDQHETVDAGLSPRAENIIEDGLSCKWFLVNHLHESRINHVMMRYDKQHQDNAV